ncbi:toxin [Paraburkholderia guartelaensis]|uniref:Toxin n=1 Tax=Paraburkholderia guartelaensis TaxID=2546446 RepID=A0A4R5L350_9BURK|nr:SpvB/TcaC N-terminal domain-containing protein [Paraburkholderia guartelaensis]TDG02547.1 toxin [Paraburkholderia guartelaensis]
MAENGSEGDNGQPGPTGKPSPFTPPQISLPKGGGAIRGIDEKFSANPVTGTGSLSVPLALSPGRSGFGPQLSVEYDSGSGNGVFGIGWKLSLPSITRRTDKGLPQYHDCIESDIFILSGAEDLVPVLLREDEAQRRPDEFERDGYRVKRYRPRIEGLFARIERWTCIESGDVHWRSLSKDNVLTVYGLDAASRIADPENPAHVFSWLICRSYDDTGNAIVYDYVPEDGRGVDLALPSEQRRRREANRYLKRIRYGNRQPLLLDPERPSFRRSHLEPHDLEGARWMFEVVFDYGEAHYRDAPPDAEDRIYAHASPCATADWPARRDPFSTWRSGFEIRSYRLCRRVLMFHHFPEELGDEPCLVRSTAFEYREKPIGSFLERVVQSGHRRREDGRYLTRSLPPLDLQYTPSPIEDARFAGYWLADVDPEDLANLPAGIDNAQYRLLDLDGEGIAGVLSEQAQAWLYKPNLGNGRFGALQTAARMPSTTALDDSRQQFMDLSGDGVLDLVDLAPTDPGFYERKQNAAWEGFRPFRALPVRDWADPNLRFVDLTGDGIADILVTQDDAFTWHPSLWTEGFGHGRRVPVPLDEEHGPRVVFADNAQSLYLADMTGDGLSDLVRVRNGEICYWPNRGYGGFGVKVTMDRAPWLDAPDLFDEARIRLADTDGSGTTDIVYLGRDGVTVYLNESGNGWSAARQIRPFPCVDDIASITVADLLGRGTACLVWSSPLPGDAGRQLRYLDLMCGRKPHLLERTINNLGAETRIDYASSTQFYLADKAAGTPWVTRLPFPVHVVERVETFDRVSRNRFVSRYSYHHGYYDGVEREFRGFGRVDQLDTEALAALSQSDRFPRGDNLDAASSVPPVLTRTWYHTGVFLEGGRISRHLAHEYYQEGAGRCGESTLSHEQIQAMLLDDTVLPVRLDPEEAREACRSLKGAMLRQEIYGLDSTEAAGRPYSVTESNFTIRTLQRRGPNRYGVFFTHAREQVSFHYERKLYEIEGHRRADPRVSHALTLEVDDYGNVLKSVAVGYGRRHADPSPLLTDNDREQQARLQMTLTESDCTNTVAEADAWRTPLPAGQRQFELLNMKPRAELPRVTNLFRFAELADKVASASNGSHELPFADWRGLGAVGVMPWRRPLKWTRSLYRANDLRRLLAPGRLEALALPGQNYTLAFPGGLLTEVYRRRYPTEDLFHDRAAVLREAGYVDVEGDGNWWTPSGRVFYAADRADLPDEADCARHELGEALRHFFAVRRHRDPFGNVTHVNFDRHDLAPVETVDPVGNINRADLCYRVLLPRLITDPNGNRSEVAFDALGLVAGIAVMGKSGEKVGDSLEGFEPDPTTTQLGEFFADPHGCALRLIGNATTRTLYDVRRYFAAQRAVFSAMVARETHVSNLHPGDLTRTQIALHFSDGFGREVQVKKQAAPGPVGSGGPTVAPRWISNGWTIYNNKGKPVRQYEPFFTASHDFEFAAIRGVSKILFYDPAERVVAILNPEKTWSKVVFDPWRQTSSDANDTVLASPQSDPDVGAHFRRLPRNDYLPTWYEQRIDGRMGPALAVAAQKAARHANTPTVAYIDTLGRNFLAIDDNGGERKYRTRTVLDIEGNRRVVIDAFDREVLRCAYDMGGVQVHEASMEAGERWLLKDIGGRPVRSWNSRRYEVRTEYDALRRPLRSFVRGGDPYERNARPFPEEILFERAIYGDAPDTGMNERRQRAANLRGKPYRHFDTAGIVTTSQYDFKGNLLHSERKFCCDFRSVPNWSRHPSVEAERFTGSTTYDALNRQVTVQSPDGSVCHARFNETGLLEAIDVALRAAEHSDDKTRTPFVRRIDYNARGQRQRVEYGNGARTDYEYDPQTFRLIRLHTARPFERDAISAQILADESRIQDLHYTFDPIGNITEIADHALRTVFHRNSKIDPVCRYTYDALYRLICATGRENIGQSTFDLAPHDGNYRDYPYLGAARLKDPQALRQFTEHYEYDPVGNFVSRLHRAEHGSWTRHYSYCEKSLLEPGKNSNRLSRTHLQDDAARGPERYLYDASGGIVQMPHLPVMQWDFLDRLAASARQVVKDVAAETTFYVYDAYGQRVRKVTERQNGIRKNERLYLGGFEVFREYDGDGDAIVLERESLHVVDDKVRIALVETLTINKKSAISAPEPVQRYQLANLLGSATLELDEAARLISYEEYEPYGGTVYQAGPAAAEVRQKRYRYTGKERDEENGFTYHGARYYAPWLARWASCDPASAVRSVNLYQYALLNPVTYYDPDGQDPKNDPFNLFSKRQDPNPDKLPFNPKTGELDPRYFPPPAAYNREDLDKIRSTSPDNVIRRWGAVVRNWAWSKSAEENYQASKKPELQPVRPNAALDMTDQIVKGTPEIAGQLWLIFVGSLKTGAPAPIEPPPVSPAARAATIYGRIVDAVKSAGSGAEGENVALNAFKGQGNVAVARVTIAGRVRVYVGIKVPKGSMRAVDTATGKATQYFPTKEVGEWLKKNVLLPGEELADVTASTAHAEDSVKNAILRDAKAAKVDPSTIEGSVGAGTPVCEGCQQSWQKDLPKVAPDNPAPPK